MPYVLYDDHLAALAARDRELREGAEERVMHEIAWLANMHIDIEGLADCIVAAFFKEAKE